MNTNKSDLYGMIRGDEALISRVVVLRFRPRGALDWDAVRAKFLNLDATFGYSLKHYLETEYDIEANAPKFSVSRYYEQDKYDFINEALGNNKTTVDEWLDVLHTAADCSSAAEHGFAVQSILRDATFKGVAFKYVVKNECYKHYEQNTRAGADKYKSQNFYKILADKGFVEIQTRIYGAKVVILRMEAANWDAMMQASGPVAAYEDMDNDCV
jgi:hypothetical protein